MADAKAQIVLSAVDETRPAFESARRNLVSLTTETKRAAFQQQQLAFQLNDFFVQIASGGNPFTALIQQGSQLSGTFGGTGNAVKAVLGLLTPARVLFGGVAGAVGGLALAAYQGAEELRGLKDALTLSGNFAGTTAGQFDAMAQQIRQSSTIALGAVREAGAAIAATGNVGPKNFTAATEAAARFAQATGKTADEVAKSFAEMDRDAAKWALDYNRSLNFITAAQYLQIKSLQESGRAADAQAIVYEAMNDRLRKLDGNLGSIDQLLQGGRQLWSDWWEAAKGFGRPQTVQDELEAIERRLRAAREAASAAPGIGAADLNAFSGKPTLGGRDAVARLEAEREAILRRQLRQSENAMADAENAATQKAGIEARQRLDGMLAQVKGAEALSKALKQNELDFKAAAAAGVPYTEAQKKAITDETRKKFTPTPDADQRQTLRKQVDGRVDALRAGLERERDVYQNANSRLAEAYADGDLTIDQFYDAKQKAQLDYLVKLQEGFDAEIKEWQAYRAKVSKPQERQVADNEIAKAVAQQSKAFREAGQAAEAAEAQRVRATESFKRSLSELDAQLKDLSGDRYGAELIRNAQRLEEARKLLAAGGGDPKRLGELGTQLQRQADTNRLQERLSLVNDQQAVAEEAYLLTARARGTSLADQERGIQAIRERSIGQLEKLTEEARALAKVSGDPRMTLWADQLQLALEKARAQANPTLERMTAATDSFADGVAGAVESVLVDFQSLNDAFNNIGKMIQRLVTQTLVIDPLREGLRGLLKTGLTGLFSGGAGGAASGIAGAASSAVVSAGAGVAGTAAQAATQAASQATATTALSTLATSAASAGSGVAGLGLALSPVTGALGSLLTAATLASAALERIAAQGAGSAITGVLKGGGGGGGAGELVALVAHSGGVVGDGGNFRSVSVAAFDNAFRYRTGGIAGFAPDEVPAVLHRGEEVLTQGDPRHRDNGGGRPSKLINLNINVTATAGMSKQSAMQQGAAAGRAARAALARND
jgi:phage-related minor tail protein